MPKTTTIWMVRADSGSVMSLHATEDEAKREMDRLRQERWYPNVKFYLDARLVITEEPSTPLSQST